MSNYLDNSYLNNRVGYTQQPYQYATQKPNFAQVAQQPQIVQQEKPAENKLKKYAISLGLTLATVVGLAVLGNKSSNFMAHFGQTLDKSIGQSSLYKSISSGLASVKNSIVKFLKKSKTMEDIFETLSKRKATAKWDFARGYGKGFKSIFALTPPDTFRTILHGKSEAEAITILEKLVSPEKARIFAKQIQGHIPDNMKFCNELTTAICEKFGAKTNVEKLKIFERIQKGELGSEFCNVVMNKTEGVTKFIGNWWPVNFIDSLGKKIRGDKWKGFCRGNLGDALIKYNVVNGSLADTTVGALGQKLITVPSESISNFVNDKSGLGVLLCLSIMSLYNNVQNAPKEKRAATIANDYMGTLGSIAIATPMASAATYGLASLANLEGKTFLSKGLRQIGKFFHIGLGDAASVKSPALQKTLNVGGGVLRFAMIMFMFMPFVQKYLTKGIQKVFGKPYDASEEATRKATQQLQNQMSNFDNMTPQQQQEFMNYVNQDPELSKLLIKQAIIRRNKKY